MTAENKYLFETDFGDLAAVESKTQKYSEEDIASARQAAAQEMRDELRDFEEKRAADMLAEMSAKLGNMSAERARDLQSATESAVEIGVAMCRKVLPALAAQNALSEIEGHITRTLAEVHGEPRVVVRVSEENVARLQPGIDSLAGGFDGKIVLLADDQLAASDCHVMWADGGCDRDVQRTLSEIDKAVEQIIDIGIGSAPADPAIGPDQGAASVSLEISTDFNEIQPFSKAID